jgi:hypothetical protein
MLGSGDEPAAFLVSLVGERTAGRHLATFQRVCSGRPGRFVIRFPMICVQVYLTLTVLLFAFGPWPWPVTNPGTLYPFLFLGQLALWMGYNTAVSAIPTKYVGRWNGKQLFDVALIVSLIWILPNFMNRAGLASLDLREIYANIQLGLTDPGLAYVKRLQLEDSVETRTAVTYLTILVSPVLCMFLPLGISQWRSLARWKKGLMLLAVVGDLFTWIASGTNKGIADLLFLVPFFIIVGRPVILNRLNLVRFAAGFVLAGAGVYGFLTFFSAGMSSRPGSATVLMSDYSIGISVDESNITLRALPDEMRGAAASLSTYLTQGYYGLSLCLDQPFLWSYGLGHSFYLPSWYKKIDPGSDVASRSYPGRPAIDAVWPYLHRWQSIYPWLASDVTFPGSLIVMFFVGRLFAKTWQDILWCDNPVAICLFGLLLIMLFYVPANNQILAFPTSAASFWVLLLWWWRSRRKIVAAQSAA